MKAQLMLKEQGRRMGAGSKLHTYHVVLLGKILLDLVPVHDEQGVDVLGEGQAWQQLGCEQEALWGARPAAALH